MRPPGSAALGHYRDQQHACPQRDPRSQPEGERTVLKDDGMFTCIQGDALKVLPDLEGEYDFVFIDALKQDYFKYFKALEPKM